MNKEEYLKAKRALEEEFKAKDKELAKQFAASNNPVKIGDVITDHYKTIRVEMFVLFNYYDYMMPCIKYVGTRLNKKGEPAKRDTSDNGIIQKDIREINGKPYKYEIV